MAPRYAPPAEALQVADNFGRFLAPTWRACPSPENRAAFCLTTSSHFSRPNSLTDKQIEWQRKDLHSLLIPGRPDWYSGCPYLRPKTTSR
jgi:hypothetical protein